MPKSKQNPKRKKLKFIKPPAHKQLNPVPKGWKLTIEKEGFDKLRHNPEFIQILNLARITNALNFCYKASLDSGEAKTPSERRQLFYAMSFCSAVLYEGLTCAKKLEEYFFDYDSYKKGFEVLLNAPLTKEIMTKNSRFDKIRNRVTYHFNPSIFEDVLTWAEFDSYVFGSGHSDKNGDIFYSLPEDLAINFLIGEHKEIEEGTQIYNKMMKEIVSVMIRFFDSSQALINEALLKKGWKVQFVGD